MRLTRFCQRPLVIILFLALALRVGASFWQGDRMADVPVGGTHDQISYDMLAMRLASGHGFTFPTYWYPWVPADTPTSYYSGTMVLSLAVWYKLFGYHPIIPRLFYSLLGALTCLFVYRLTCRLWGQAAGLAACAWAAGYAYLILYSSSLLTETPFILALLVCLDRAYILRERRTRVDLAVFSLALGVTVLFRMAVLPFALGLLIWLFTATPVDGRGRRWQVLVFPLLTTALLVAPWTLRNYALYHRFMLLESQFGHVFWNANHPGQGYVFHEVAWIAPIPAELRRLSEPDLTSELLRRGVREVLTDPVRYLSLCLSRIPLFFLFWPTRDSSLASNLGRVLSFGISLPFMLTGLIMSFRRARDFFPLYLFMILHSGIYLASWVMVRYRVPLDAILITFAAPVAVRLWDHLRLRASGNARSRKLAEAAD